MRHNIRGKYKMPPFVHIITTLFVGSLFIFALVTFFYRSKHVIGDQIVADISLLARIMQQIDGDCTILGFDSQKNPINFLNVKSFVGSEVGSMNLVHPEHWKGPYLRDNLTVQGIEYQIVSTNQGYFITPGDGVKLPNGKVIGKDIIFDEQADIALMAKDPSMLMYNGRPLAVQIHITKPFSLFD